MISRIGWIVTALVLLYFQFQLVSPRLTFSALYRAPIWLVIIANIGFAAVVGFRMFEWRPFRFTIRSLVVATLLASFSFAMVYSLQNHSAMKIGFAFSKSELTNCTINGKVDDKCGRYTITAITKGDGFTALFTTGTLQHSFDTCGFLYVDDDRLELRDNLLEEYSTHYFLPLGDGWYAFFSWYNWNKLGWS